MALVWLTMYEPTLQNDIELTDINITEATINVETTDFVLNHK